VDTGLHPQTQAFDTLLTTSMIRTSPDSARLDSTVRAIVRDEMRFLRNYTTLDTVRWDTILRYEAAGEYVRTVFDRVAPMLSRIEHFYIDTTGRK
jgi:hypothetical protein